MDRLSSCWMFYVRVIQQSSCMISSCLPLRYVHDYILLDQFWMSFIHKTSALSGRPLESRCQRSFTKGCIRRTKALVGRADIVCLVCMKITVAAMWRINSPQMLLIGPWMDWQLMPLFFKQFFWVNEIINKSRWRLQYRIWLVVES